MTAWRAAALSLACTMSLFGCGTLPGGRGWGEDATLRPGWQRVKLAAVNSARDPWVWAPLMGAAMFQIDDWDARTSDWARRNTPVFGSQQSAKDWSDDLRSASVMAHYATILATPSGGDAGDWLISKAKGALVDAAAVSITGAVTQQFKSGTARQRPNGADRESFPSGHTSSSAVHTRLASRNLDCIAMPPLARVVFDAGLNAMTLGTAWARIEAGWHYPADTLAGMALGNFVGAFVNDAFLGIDQPGVAFSLAATDGGALVRWNVSF